MTERWWYDSDEYYVCMMINYSSVLLSTGHRESFTQVQHIFDDGCPNCFGTNNSAVVLYRIRGQTHFNDVSVICLLVAYVAYEIIAAVSRSAHLCIYALPVELVSGHSEHFISFDGYLKKYIRYTG